jgi:hypothetical protein
LPPATGPTTAPAAAAAAAPLPGPKAIAVAFAAAVERGDAASARAQVNPADPAHVRWATATVELAAALKRLDAAAAARFGDAAPGVSQKQFHLGESVKALEQGQEKIEGEEATVSVGGGGQAQPLRFRKLEGKWSLVPPVAEGNAERTIGLYNRLAKAADRTASEIAGGVHPSAGAARGAFEARVTEARLAY